MDKFEERQIVFDKLGESRVVYEVIEHPPVFTIDEMDALGLFNGVGICKNLFVRNAKGDRHYLIVLSKNKQANLKLIASQLGESRLSFASEERLAKHLGLTKGEVTPLAVINDSEHAVKVAFDKDLAGKERLGVHPNDNTATVIISFDDLQKYVETYGSEPIFLDIE